MINKLDDNKENIVQRSAQRTIAFEMKKFNFILVTVFLVTDWSECQVVIGLFDCLTIVVRH